MSGGPDAAKLASAFGLLQSGRAQEALAIAEKVAARTRSCADALHLKALCHKALGDDKRAAAAFDAAMARAPRDPNLLGNYANFLTRTGRPGDAIAVYRRLLGIAPDHADGWYNLGLALLNAGDAQEARSALLRAADLRPAHAATWQALGSAQRASGNLEEAAAALQRAVELEPGNARALVSLGVARRLLGEPAAALACYADAKRAGFQGPELLDAEASAQLDTGDVQQALDIARELVSTHPAYVPGHAFLAQLLWEHGARLAPGEAPSATFAAALEAEPAHDALRREYARFLLASGDHETALEQVRELRRRGDTPALAAMEADALGRGGEHAAAAALLESALPALRGDAAFLNLYTGHLLRAGDAEQAAARAEESLALDPQNQLALAFLGVAWRLLADPREDWLCGYDRLVAEIAIEPPGGYADTPAFLQALEAALLPLHTAEREPVEQSLRGGSQTAGVLLGRPEPVFAALRERLAEVVAAYVAGLPDDADHPFLRRKSAARFQGSWSVRLRSSGRHVNHIHQEGWISSAFYVALPPSIAAGNTQETDGCLQFGEPPAELGLDIGPRRIVRPSAGHLVLFPSYLWHGTVPFEDTAPRLTVAFDAVPACLASRYLG